MALFASRFASGSLARGAASRCFGGTSVCNGSATARNQLEDVLGQQLKDIEEAGTWKTERVITSRQANTVTVSGKSVLNFCANNYLGLSSHQDVISAAQRALDSHGAGLSSVRFICGTQDIHMDLEAKIAQFHEREASILYASCFDANAGLFEAMLSPEDAVLSDELNHASIIDGIRLCKAQKNRFKHMDMEDLESKLAAVKSTSRMRLIVTDGVFSMDGDVAPLVKIVELAKKYDALVFIDECHATGFLGKTGRGTEEYLGIRNEVDIINSTLGKALGGAAGGYTAGPASLVSLLRQKSRPYLFSNSLPPPVVAAASKVFDMLMDDSSLTERVAANTTLFRHRMTDAGFTIMGDNHPICPVWLGDARLASEFSDEMLEKGIYVIGFSFPVVPTGKARIRVQLSAIHTTEDVNRCVDSFIEIGKKKGVI